MTLSNARFYHFKLLQIWKCTFIFVNCSTKLLRCASGNPDCGCGSWYSEAKVQPSTFCCIINNSVLIRHTQNLNAQLEILLARPVAEQYTNTETDKMKLENLGLIIKLQWDDCHKTLNHHCESLMWRQTNTNTSHLANISYRISLFKNKILLTIFGHRVFPLLSFTTSSCG